MYRSKYTTYSGPCEYIKERQQCITYCYCREVSSADLSRLLARGWRKFGEFYFKDNCPGCLQCVPIRVPVKSFKLSRSQRRILKKNSEVKFSIGPLNYKEEIFEIYRDHSINRFGRKKESFEDFLISFYTPSCPAIQTEYYIDDKLAGVGFLDVAGNALSSVYFMFRDEFKDYSLGTFSILKEIEVARMLKKKYYYLGYYIESNRFMRYKNAFSPHQKMDWKSGKWTCEEESENGALNN